ncbi:substrate-binding domain-containing protein [Yeosuana marina]|uniref:substrate-binding domain-containing protein n=1 Tax=Yeosuana marina TaxID=1565536 RepID=UPI0030C7A712
MIRIKDIAAEANVSEGTVDRVIHNRGGVSKKTEEKVKNILQKRNFSLNPVASALAMQKKHKISVLIPEYNNRDIFWKSPCLGILKAMEDIQSLGVKVDIFKFNQYNPNSYSYTFRKLIKTNPSAVILVPMFFKETRTIVNTLERSDIKYMFLNIELDGFEKSIFIGQDSYKAGFIAGKLMHLSLPENGYFLIIQSKHNIGDNNAISKRIVGFKDYFKSNKIDATITYLNLENLNDLKNTKKQLEYFLDKNPNINGLFIPSSRISNIVECLSKNKIKQLKMIGFDNTPQNIEYLKKGDISFLISQKPYDQGYEAIRIMKDFLINNKQPLNKHFLPIEILLKENVVGNEISQW